MFFPVFTGCYWGITPTFLAVFSAFCPLRSQTMRKLSSAFFLLFFLFFYSFYFFVVFVW
uniref:Uncharacterized protein n=1 Tax=Anguilla anguilla TaxID=7936 RepID=A0A0E9UIZ3_ANGAN